MLKLMIFKSLKKKLRKTWNMQILILKGVFHTPGISYHYQETKSSFYGSLWKKVDYKDLLAPV